MTAHLPDEVLCDIVGFFSKETCVNDKTLYFDKVCGKMNALVVDNLVGSTQFVAIKQMVDILIIVIDSVKQVPSNTDNDFANYNIWTKSREAFVAAFEAIARLQGSPRVEGRHLWLLYSLLNVAFLLLEVSSDEEVVLEKIII
uniref:Uncharacterized protein n=1 Tax=Ditylenchus dipsaci TaxID=166011 RepID=A0A915CMD0_9BILA